MLTPHFSLCGAQRSRARSGLTWGLLLSLGLVMIPGSVNRAEAASPEREAPLSANKDGEGNRNVTIILPPRHRPPFPDTPHHPNPGRYRYPRYPYPTYPQTPRSHRVRVEFIAEGEDWGTVYLDNRVIYTPHNFNRRETVLLPPGGYHLQITGVAMTDLWASGYLDVGVGDSNILVVTFSKNGGVRVSGNSNAWIPMD